jgi:ligand-binding SRPBCC domain-containing protein
MQIYKLIRIQNIPISIDEAWNFFSRPENLSKITPPAMDFVILSDVKDIEMHDGMIIHYSVKPLLGFPLKWESEIKEIKEKQYFIDIQRKGPYKLWRHKHVFREIENGVEMIDDIDYALPLGILGQLANKLIVNRQLATIFDFRVRAVKDLFGEF